MRIRVSTGENWNKGYSRLHSMRLMVTFETCGVVQNVGSRLEILNLRSNKRLCPVDETMLGILEHISDQVSEREVGVFVN